MDLFDNLVDPAINLLLRDGTVNYYGAVMPADTADMYLRRLLDGIAWQNDVVALYGRRIVTKREVAWYGDRPFDYTYSNSTKRALLWTDELLDLKRLVEQQSAETYNSCLLNLYPDGSAGMGWHSDAEKELQENGAIASLSLGAARRFDFRHKQTKETVSVTLPHGSLLIMKAPTQSHWAHRLPISRKISTPRINLTFRTVVDR